MSMTLNENDFVLTDEMKNAEMEISAGVNIFITGGAGVGKSTFIKYMNNKGLDFIFLAPTGLIASNGVVAGSTLHSFFKIPFGLADSRNLKSSLSQHSMYLLKKVDCIIIDEVSMVRSDTFDFIDVSLRNALGNDVPFGGKQIILIGDLFQLPPVVSSVAENQALNHLYGGKYFFQTRSFKYANFKTIEFTQVFRQKDEIFVDVLNGVKTGTCTQKDVDLLNSRVTRETSGIVLTTTNRIVDSYNQQELMMLDGEEENYHASYQGEINWNNTRLQQRLDLKIGCRIMTIFNNNEKGFSNGTLGEYRGMNASGEIIMLTDSGSTVYVPVIIYSNKKQKFNISSEKIDEEILGSITQYPVVLAYASSVHKSQGMTFDSLTFDIGNGVFDTGQLYVALSRCKTLNGLCLRKPLSMSDIMVDKNVVEFYSKNKYNYEENKLV